MVENQKSVVKVKEAFREQQEKQGGVIPSRMKVGDFVLVETDNFMYKLTKESRHWFVESGHPLVRTNNMVIGFLCADPFTLCKMDDWIGKGMVLTMETPYGLAITTKPVVSAIVGGKNYEVSVWD